VLEILANTGHSAHMQSVSCLAGSLCVVIVVEAVMVMMKTADVSETNVLVYAGARPITDRRKFKPKGSHIQKGPLCKKWLEKQIRFASCYWLR